MLSLAFLQSKQPFSSLLEYFYRHDISISNRIEDIGHYSIILQTQRSDRLFSLSIRRDGILTGFSYAVGSGHPPIKAIPVGSKYHVDGMLVHLSFLHIDGMTHRHRCGYVHLGN